MSLSLALLASVFYALGTLAALAPSARPERLRLVPWLGCAALAAHLLMLFAHGRGRGLDLHFFNALSVTAALCVLGLLLLMHWQRLQRLAAVVFPIAAVAVLLALLIDGRPGAHGIADWRIATHAGLAVLAFAILSIAGVVALQLGLQDHALRTHQFSRMFSGAPPLVQVEQLLFQLIGAGFLVLTLALVTGVLFVEDLMAQHLAHKTAAVGGRLGGLRHAAIRPLAPRLARTACGAPGAGRHRLAGAGLLRLQVRAGTGPAAPILMRGASVRGRILWWTS